MSAQRLFLTAVCAVSCTTLLSVRAELAEITSLGTASQTTDWPTGQFPAANAVDGLANTFSHTDGGTLNNAWELSFADEHEIARVEVQMRGDCCGGRLATSVLRWFDSAGDSVFSVPVQDDGIGQTFAVDLPAGVFGKSLRIGLENGASNPGGNGKSVHLAEVRVYELVDLLPVITAFTASPADITGGGSATLSWQTEAADSVELLGQGAVAGAGSLAVSPVASEVYTLVASNAEGSRSASAAVIVDGVPLAPRITEFMASNDSALVRSDGSSPDWIEIWNPNSTPLDLAGYRLTDDPEQPARYVFASLSVPAGGYLVVDAAAASVDGVPATGFALDRSAGSVLTLAAPAGAVLQSITYPRQRADVSYGAAPGGGDKFFLAPTPGGPNASTAVDGFVADTQFSVKRGFYESPQSVAISTETAGATIYTTTDGSAPTPDNPAATAYAAPLAISTTTVLRAAAYLDGYQPTDVDTQTYLFAADVGAQSSAPAGFPQAWVPSLNGVQASVSAFSHFGMDDGVVNSLPLTDAAGAGFDLVDALTAIPTMSLVIDADELLDSNNGLHINASQRGRAWEREASIEFLDPATGAGYHANCGLRMHGGWNRFPEMLKKSFRLYFRSEYGDSKWDLPLFPDSEIDSFDALILRSGNGKSWASPWRALSGSGNSLERNTYLRDQFARDLQAATGNDFIPGRFVHLYINGHYWGLYNPVERPDESFAEARYGGADEDYDVIKWARGIGHRVAAGDDVAWNALIALVRGDTADPATYAAVGAALDLPQFVDYMLVNYFIGNQDWIDNNVYAMRDRAGGGPFRFYCWDSEESLLNVNSDRTGAEVTDTCTEIHQALRDNAEYRQLFADRAQRHFFNGGALTPEGADAVFAARAAEIDRAIVGDSARWGSLLRPSDPYDRADWLAEVTNIRSNYLTTRTATTLAQLRADSLYPDLPAPTFSPQRGGAVAPGFMASLEAPVGTIYYTTDGSDPRLPGGGISPAAVEYTGLIQSQTLVPAGGAWRYLDDDSDLGGSDIVVGAPAYSAANWKHPDFDDSAWAAGPAPLGYGTISGRTIATFIASGPSTDRFVTAYFRRDFTVTGAAGFVSLTLKLMRDDGAVVYLNGQEVARSEFPAGTGVVGAESFAVGVAGSAEGEFLSFTVPPGLLVEGENTLAVEVHNASSTSSDLGFDLELVGRAPAEGDTIAIAEDTLLRVRALDGGEWSALDEALYLVGSRADGLYVSELMYHPEPGGAEFLEIANRSSVTHTLEDLRLSGGIDFDFASASIAALAPGERIVLVRDAVAFAAAYPGIAFAGEYDGALGNGGDTFSLEQSDATVLWTLSFGDDAPRPGGTDGEGHSMIYVGGDVDAPGSWRPSVALAGNPGTDDALALPPGGDLISYALRGIDVTMPDGLVLSTALGADAVLVQPEWSSDLITWQATGLSLSSQVPVGDGTMVSTWRLDGTPSTGRQFFRAAITER